MTFISSSPHLRYFFLIFALPSLALAASCVGDSADVNEESSAALTAGATSATLTLSNDWGSGYCANVTVSNAGSTATTTWTVVINLNQSTFSNIWSANASTSGSTLTVTPMSYGAAVAPGSSVAFGFCANGNGNNYRPTITSVIGVGNGGSTGTGGSNATGGATATGGTVGTGGTASTGGSAGGSTGALCAFPSSEWGPFNGNASFTSYFFAQGSYRDDLGYRTACGYIGQEPGGAESDTVQNIATSGYFAAITGISAANFNTVSSCGACAQISNGSKSIIATIVDECPISSTPTCAGIGHLALSRAAFNALAYTVGNPSYTTWKYVPCPVSGGIVVRVKAGSPNQVFIENVILPVQAVSVNGKPAQHLSYGAWELPLNASVGLTLTLTDSSGRVTNVRIADTNPAHNTSTGTQEPVCQ